MRSIILIAHLNLQCSDDATHIHIVFKQYILVSLILNNRNSYMYNTACENITDNASIYCHITMDLYKGTCKSTKKPSDRRFVYMS